MKIGDKEVDVKQYRNDWALALMSQGVIVKLSVSRWRASASLTHEELGLQFASKDGIDFMSKYISLGSEKLLPPEVLREIEAIERRARFALREHSFDTVWGWFVPYTAYESWEKENEEVRKDFFLASEKLGEKYKELIVLVKEEYRKLGEDVWHRMHPNDTGKASESFLEDFVNKIVMKIPSKSEILSSFKYDVTYFNIPMPSIIEENITRARQEEINREMKEYESNLEKNTKQKIANEYIKRKQELIDNFLQATVVSIRRYVSELCDSVLQAMAINSQKGDITKQQRDKIKKMIGKVKMLNFHNDDEIKQSISDLESEIDKFKGERDKNVIVEKLQHIVDMGTKDFLPSNFNPTIGTLEV